jgi:peptidoglycan hydrolase-like protein with peptidoglycan-binding domain
MDDAAKLVGGFVRGFRVVGVQFANRGAYDSDVFDRAWLADVAGGPTIPPKPPATVTTEEIMATLPELAQGATGGAVRTLQGLLLARSFHLGTSGPFKDGLDGNFGSLTHSAVIAFQEESRIKADGIVGPSTWSLLPLV